MRFPIKANRGEWPRWLVAVLPAGNDVRLILQADSSAEAFARGVSALKFGDTFKTTEPARYPLMTAALAQLPFDRPPVVLDVGASDGSAALELIRSMSFARYYVTDRNPEIWWRSEGGSTFFYDPHGTCLLVAARRCLFYPDVRGARWPLGPIAGRVVRGAPRFDPAHCTRLALVSPAVREAGDAVQVRGHDLFDPWVEEVPDIVIAANILNPVYFTTTQLNEAIRMLLGAFGHGGWLAIVDNRPEEKGSLYRIGGSRITLERSIRGGTDVADLIPETRPGDASPGTVDPATRS